MDVASPLLLQNNLPPLQLDTSSQPPSMWPDLAWKTCHSEKTGCSTVDRYVMVMHFFWFSFAEFSSAKLDKMYHKCQFQSVIFLMGSKRNNIFGSTFKRLKIANVTIITSVAFLNTRKKWRLRRHFCSLRLPIETSIGISLSFSGILG